MMWWPTIITMCTGFVCFATVASPRYSRSSKDHVTGHILATDVCFTWNCIRSAFSILGSMNASIDPCDDFYEFTCGKFVETINIPEDAYAENMYYRGNEELEIRLKYIIEDIDKEKVAKPFKLVRILYDSCMISGVDEDQFSEYDFYEYYDSLSSSSGWPVIAGNQWNFMGMHNREILSDLLSVRLTSDVQNGRNLVPWIELRSRGLDQELLRMGWNNDIVQTYYSYMVDVAVMFGADQALAEMDLKKAVLVEINLANDPLAEGDRWIPSRAYTRITVGEFIRQYPKLDLREFVYASVSPAYQLTDNDAIMVPKAFSSLANIISETPKITLANLVWWHRVKSLTALISDETRDRMQQFESLRMGNVRAPEQWKKCVRAVKTNLGLSLSALYQRKYIDQKTARDIDEIAAFIKQEFHMIVQEAEWLDAASKSEALRKVENMIGNVAYREEYKDDTKLDDFYRKLELVDYDFRLNTENIRNFLWNTFNNRLRKPLERDDWTTDGDFFSTNAVYKRQLNAYRVPALFIVPDYYYLYRQKFLNYAALGFAIAHEISHSLDSTGILFDKDANLREWWASETKRKFDARAKCMVEQYGNYSVAEVGLKLRAYHNLDENIADNVGVKTAYRAYLKWTSQHKKDTMLPGLIYTPRQMFWISLGNSWCTKYQQAALKHVILVDPHSPAKLRVNGALVNSPEFSSDFNCALGSKMNPVKKCSVW